MSVAPLSSEPVSEIPQAAPAPETELSPESRLSLFWRSGIVLILAIVIGLSYVFNPPINVQAKSGVLMELPVFVGDYFGQQGEITAVEHRLLPKDTEFARRNYDDSKGHMLTCSIVLSGADQSSIHRPEGCLDGQGWTIVSQDNVPVPLDSGHTLVARNLSLERQVTTDTGDHVTVRAYYLYWFVGNNVTTPSHFQRILLSNWDRVIHNRAHRWAYVSLFALVSDNLRPGGLSPDETKTMMTDFARRIVPTFQISEMPQSAQN